MKRFLLKLRKGGYIHAVGRTNAVKWHPVPDLPPESGPVFMLGLVNNEVVGIADEKVRAFLKFFIQIIQEDVGK